MPNSRCTDPLSNGQIILAQTYAFSIPMGSKRKACRAHTEQTPHPTKLVLVLPAEWQGATIAEALIGQIV